MLLLWVQGQTLKTSVPEAGGAVVALFICVQEGQCLGSDPRRGA